MMLRGWRTFLRCLGFSTGRLTADYGESTLPRWPWTVGLATVLYKAKALVNISRNVSSWATYLVNARLLPRKKYAHTKLRLKHGQSMFSLWEQLAT